MPSRLGCTPVSRSIVVIPDRKPYTVARASNLSALCLDAGYEHPVGSVMEDLLACLDDPRLPLLQWNELYAVAQSRLPADLAMQLEHTIGESLMCCL